MASSAEFDYFETPRRFSAEDIEGAHLQAFLITGIVNPFGSTLSFIATVGRSAQRPLIYAMLNPFSCEVKQIGTFAEGESWYPDEEFAILARFLSGSCPTLVLTASALDSETRLRITENVFARFEDAETVLENVRQFFGNPMDRVSRAIGIRVPDPGKPPPEIAHADWSELVSDTRHVWPELQAFMYAWDGSINQSGISDEMKYQSFNTDRMKAILYPMLDSVWMPEPIRKKPDPPKTKTDRPQPAPKNLDEVTQLLLNRRSWEDMRGDSLLQFMEWCLLLYGEAIDSSLVPHLSALYHHVVEHVDPEHRKLQLERVSLAAEKYQLAACTLLPPLLCDDDAWVVSTAMIDYVALSHPDPSGLPFEFSELDAFFGKGMFDSRGGALGGLITSGDRRFHSKVHEWKEHLDENDVRVATNCRTPSVTHGEIVFWLDWADELVDRRDKVSEAVFGLVASAVALLGKHNPHNVIRDIERRYPAYDVENAVIVLQSWERSEYAQQIAVRLYRLEDAEAAPKVFSAVLRAWGLEPRADLMDQLIPED